MEPLSSDATRAETTRQWRGARGARPLAQVLAGVLAAFLVLNTYWGFGGEWGIEEATGGGPVPPLWAVWVQEGPVLAGIVVVLARGGVLHVPVPRWIVAVGIWTMAAVLALVAVLNVMAATVLERVVFAPAAGLLAAIALSLALRPGDRP